MQDLQSVVTILMEIEYYTYGNHWYSSYESMMLLGGTTISSKINQSGLNAISNKRTACCNLISPIFAGGRIWGRIY